MRKISVLLLSICLIFSVVGFASATSFTDVKNFNGGWGQWLGGSGDFSWQHNTPTAFAVPYDIVNSATITLSLGLVNCDNDTLYAEGNLIGTLTNSTWSWKKKEWSHPEYDVLNVFTLWDSGDKLDLKVYYNEGEDCWDGLYLYASTFKLDYTNGTAPVPEPATMLLLGLGLVGLAGFGRKRFNS